VAEPVALVILGLTVLILGSVTLAVLFEAAGRRDRLAERLAEHRRRRNGPHLGGWAGETVRRDHARKRRGRHA
jgi:hypothetical protein